MIIVRFIGGLGNQMYQYAMYRTLREKYQNIEILADTSGYYAIDPHYGFELDSVFSLVSSGKMKIATNKQLYHVNHQIPFFGGGIGNAMQKPVGWINGRVLSKISSHDVNIISEESFLSSKSVRKLCETLNHLDVNQDWRIAGYWQREEYFEHLLSQIIEDFKFPDLSSVQEMNMYNKICNSNSVSVHIRRGDYSNTEFDILGVEYYKKAISYIIEHVEEPLFFFFSEDEQYVEENFAWVPDKVNVMFNKGRNSYRDMQLMSLCRHNIVANSSFSNWAAYLNSNSNKIVIYPKRYTLTADTSKKRGWVSIDN